LSASCLLRRSDGGVIDSIDGMHRKSGLDGATIAWVSLPYIKIGIFGAINTKKVMLPQPPLLHGRMGIIATPVSYVMSCYLESWRLRRRLRNPREHSWRRFDVHQRPQLLTSIPRPESCTVLANKVDHAVAGACDCAALALPDEKYGEALCAAIVLAK